MTGMHRAQSQQIRRRSIYKLTNIGRKVLVNCATVYMVDILFGAVLRALEGRIPVVLQKDAVSNYIVYTMQCSKSTVIRC